MFLALTAETRVMLVDDSSADKDKQKPSVQLLNRAMFEERGEPICTRAK